MNGANSEWRWTELRVDGTEFSATHMWCSPGCKVGPALFRWLRPDWLQLQSSSSTTANRLLFFFMFLLYFLLWTHSEHIGIHPCYLFFLQRSLNRNFP